MSTDQTPMGKVILKLKLGRRTKASGQERGSLSTRGTRQRDETDCAAACMAAIAYHYRLKLSVSSIRLLAETGAAGTTVLGVVHAAERLGLPVNGINGAHKVNGTNGAHKVNGTNGASKVNGTNGAGEHLSEIPLHFVAHVVPTPGHLRFVVAIEVTQPSGHRVGPRRGRR